MSLFEAIRHVSQKHNHRVLVACVLLLFAPFAYSCALHIHGDGTAIYDRVEAEAPCRFLSDPPPDCVEHGLLGPGLTEGPSAIIGTERTLELPALAATDIRPRNLRSRRRFPGAYAVPPPNVCPTYLATLRIRL